MMTTQHESLKKKTHLPSLIMKIFVYLSAAITFTVLILLIAYIMIKGIPHLKPEFFSLHYTSDNVSFVPALITTVIMTALALIVAVPLGLFAAIYLVEYTGKTKKTGRDDSSDNRNIVRNSINCIRFVWYAVFCKYTGNRILDPCRCGNAFYYDSAADYAYCRGSVKISSGFFSRRQFRTWCRKTSYDFSCSSSGSSAWNYGRYHSCYRTYCWRDGGANVHGRNGCEDSEITF